MSRGADVGVAVGGGGGDVSDAGGSDECAWTPCPGWGWGRCQTAGEEGGGGGAVMNLPPADLMAALPRTVMSLIK